MAKYSRIVRVESTHGDVNFYKSEDGYHMRNKCGVSKNRISKDPTIKRTLENKREFEKILKVKNYYGMP